MDVDFGSASKGALAGIVVGTEVNGGGTTFLLASASNQAGLLIGGGDSPTLSLRAPFKLKQQAGTLEIIATAKGTQFLLDGKELLKENTLSGGVVANGLLGLAAQGSGVRFHNLRLKN